MSPRHLAWLVSRFPESAKDFTGLIQFYDAVVTSVGHPLMLIWRDQQPYHSEEWPCHPWRAWWTRGRQELGRTSRQRRPRHIFGDQQLASGPGVMELLHENGRAPKLLLTGAFPHLSLRPQYRVQVRLSRGPLRRTDHRR